MYFARAYGLEYYAAWPGCADEAEPSAATVTFLIDKVKEEGIPVVFHIELSNEDMADIVCDETGAEKRLFSACHNVTRAQFEEGVTYLELMRQNVDVLRRRLADGAHKLQGLSFAYGGETVLRGVSFGVNAGDYLCVVARTARASPRS